MSTEKAGLVEGEQLVWYF